MSDLPPCPWRAIDVYYGDPDRLLLEVVRPAERGVPSGGAYWTRGYVGGLHVRLHVRGDEAAAEAVREGMARGVAALPAADPAPYDAGRAARMLREEGRDPAAFDLTPRSPGAYAGRYRPPASHLGPAAVALTEAFYADSRATAYAVLEAADRRAAALKLYLVRSLAFGGALAAGALSFRSHWERFRAEWPRAVTREIERAYERERDAVAALVDGVVAAWEGDAPDPVVEAWAPVQRAYRRRIAALVAAGALDRAVPPDPEAYRERARQHADGAPFLEVLFADADAFARFSRSPAMLAGRIHVNLLYLLLQQVGLTPLDRFALGHFAYRAIEDRTGVDLAERLRTSLHAPS